MAAPLRFSDESARRLRELLYASGPQPPGPANNQKARARTPMLVRALSDTAVGGAEVGGDQCYDAVVLDINSLVADQAEAASVWLTILDGGTTASPVTVATPVEGQAYYGLFAGTFDPDPTGTPDPRPRVFAVPGSASTAFSGVRVSLGSTTSIANNTATALSFTTEVFDTDGYHDNSTNPDRLTAPSDGYYLVGASVLWDFAQAGYRDVSLTMNGTTFTDQGISIPATPSTAASQSLSGLVFAAAGNYFQAFVLQTTGGPINVGGAFGGFSYFWAHKVG